MRHARIVGRRNTNSLNFVVAMVTVDTIFLDASGEKQMLKIEKISRYILFE